MKDRSARLALEQIRDTIGLLESYLAGKSRDDYAREPMLRHAVERCIEIVSEASRRLPDELKARHPEVPWSKVAGIGNILRHDYDEIDDAVMWHAATVEIRSLAAAIERMLSAIREEPPE